MKITKKYVLLLVAVLLGLNPTASCMKRKCSEQTQPTKKRKLTDSLKIVINNTSLQPENFNRIKQILQTNTRPLTLVIKGNFSPVFNDEVFFELLDAIANPDTLVGLAIDNCCGQGISITGTSIARITRFRNLKRLAILEAEDAPYLKITSTDLEALMRHLTDLEELHLQYLNNKISLRALEYLAQRNPNLKTLCLSNNHQHDIENIDEKIQLIAKFKNLQHLNLHVWESLVDKHIFTIITRLKNLTWLDISWTNTSANWQCIEAIVQYLPKIKWVNLHVAEVYCQLTDIYDLTNVEKLKFNSYIFDAMAKTIKREKGINLSFEGDDDPLIPFYESESGRTEMKPQEPSMQNKATQTENNQKTEWCNFYI